MSNRPSSALHSHTVHIYQVQFTAEWGGCQEMALCPIHAQLVEQHPACSKIAQETTTPAGCCDQCIELAERAGFYMERVVLAA